MIHEFHFMMNRQMKDHLCDSEAYRKRQSISGSIKVILTLLAPVIRREQKWGKQRENRYLSIKTDPKEKLFAIHIFISEPSYRELKMLHHDLNFFSIAQLVRFLIEIYLEMERVYGKNLEKELEKMFNEWKKEEKSLKRGEYRKIRQLLRLTASLPWNKRILTLYDDHFAPFWIFRL